MELHADTSQVMLYGWPGPVSCIGRLLCIDDETDTGAVRIHVSSSAPFQQELGGREVCQYLSTVSVLNSSLAVVAYVALGRASAPLACHTTSAAQCID